MNNYIIFLTLLIIILVLFVFYKKNKEGFTDDFVDNQIKYYESRRTDLKLPVDNDAEVFLKLNKINDTTSLELTGLTSSTDSVPISQVDKEVAKCKSLSSCDHLNNTNCGMCLYTGKVMYGDDKGPLADVCPGGWVKDAANCKKKKEQEICSKVKSCGTMVGEAEICGWCPSSSKAMVSKTVNGKLVPKYSDDKCMTPGIYGTPTQENLYPTSKCAEIDKDFPCYGPTMNSGPHSSQCLNKLWEQVGCSANGTSAPSKNKNIQNSWWNTQGIMTVAKDMKLYKQYADSNDWNQASTYYPRCYGTQPDPCDKKYGTTPLQCYQKKFIDTGCRKEGSSYPTKENNMDINQYIQTIQNLINTSHNSAIDFTQRNKAYNQCYGGQLIAPPKPKDIDIQPGLNAFIYENTSSSGTIGRPINTMPTRINNVNYDWGTGSILSTVSDKVYIVIEGYIIYPPYTTSVRYRIGSDDGSRLTLNGKVEVDNWGSHGFKWVNGNFRQINNQVEELKIEMYEWSGNAQLNLQWDLNGSNNWVNIPDSQFKSSIIPKQQFDPNLNPSDFVMYGPGIKGGLEAIPIKKILKDGGAVVYLTEDGQYTKFIKMWGNTPAPLYYTGTIADYGNKTMIPMTKRSYNLYNKKTGKSVGYDRDPKFNQYMYVMYGPWISSGNTGKPVQKVIQDGQAIAYIIQDSQFTKIVKMWGNTPAPLYYTGTIADYGKKNMITVPKGNYNIKNILTGKTLGQ